MPNFPALPRPIGATVLALAALILFAAALPAKGQAAPPSSGYPVAATSTAFAKTTVGNSSERLSVELTNVSEATVYITNFGVEGADTSDFVVNEFPCWELAPGASCTVALYFSPQSVGAKEASLRLDPYQLDSESIALSGTGVPAELTFSPPSHDFGVESTHENGRTTFTLTNSGEAPAVFGSFEIPNPDGNVPFWINNNSNNCPTLSQVQPGQSCSLEVEFGPRDVTSYSGELRVRFQNTVFSAALSGEGGRPNVEATENPADLGTAPVGGAGPIRTITLVNSGNLPAGFFIGIVAGGDSGSFRLLDENCSAAELMPAATCTVHLRLAPQSPGPKVARLAFFGDGDSGTMVMLHGEGIQPTATLAPSGFDFGSQAKGTKGSARTFVVSNSGSTPVSLGAAAIVGANLDQFLLAGDECTGVTLAPGQECLVRIRFAPATVGAKTATLRVSSDAGPFTASLSGLGVAPEAVAGAADSRSGKARAHFRRGSTLNAAKARCRAGAPAARLASPSAAGPTAGRTDDGVRLYAPPALIEAVLFDIDGTLLVTGGAGAVAWQRAFLELHGVEANIEEHTHAGMTDPEIAEIVFREVIGRDGSDAERSAAIAGYLSHLADAVAESDGYRVMPGIEEILPRLADAGILLGLVTGNIEPAARIKLARADLNRFFPFGGFGSDSRDRTELTKTAVERGGEAAGHPLDPARTIAVGDTPRDVIAGHGAGIKVVGVATGAYSVEEQRDAGADWPIADVTNGFPV